MGFPLPSANILCLKDYSQNLTKYEMKGTAKIPLSPLFSELEKICKCNIGLYSLKAIFHLFYELIKNPKIYL